MPATITKDEYSATVDDGEWSGRVPWFVDECRAFARQAPAAPSYSPDPDLELAQWVADEIGGADVQYIEPDDEDEYPEDADL